MDINGIQKLNEFLTNGNSKGILVDIFGANGTGKTQLLLQFLTNSIKNDGNVLFFDTTGGFRPERILEIQKQSETQLDFLQKITVSRLTNTSEQIKSIEKLENENFSLIIIDNITDLFSYEYKNDDSTFEKNLLFMKYMHELSKFSIRKKIPIIFSNMIRNIEGKEIENMKSAIDPFTHIKIHLSKNASKFQGEIYWALEKKSFSYKINVLGLSDYSEDI